eukprot:m.368414 g.368414  ORF g.368414 m.368414 type:complete len:50 (+) comp44892_c0_seq1:205-354(+)
MCIQLHLFDFTLSDCCLTVVALVIVLIVVLVVGSLIAFVSCLPSFFKKN